MNNLFLPSDEQKLKVFLARLLFLSFASIWIYGFLLPLITPTDYFIANVILKRVYSVVCHQESAKCISMGSTNMLVCARCSGIYAGALIAGLLSLTLTLTTINKKVLFLSIVPLAMDVFFNLIGIYTYSKIWAFCTGLCFGSVIYLFIISELENLFTNKLYMGNE